MFFPIAYNFKQVQMTNEELVATVKKFIDSKGRDDKSFVKLVEHWFNYLKAKVNYLSNKKRSLEKDDILTVALMLFRERWEKLDGLKIKDWSNIKETVKQIGGYITNYFNERLFDEVLYELGGEIKIPISTQRLMYQAIKKFPELYKRDFDSESESDRAIMAEMIKQKQFRKVKDKSGQPVLDEQGQPVVIDRILEIYQSMGNATESVSDTHGDDDFKIEDVLESNEPLPNEILDDKETQGEIVAALKYVKHTTIPMETFVIYFIKIFVDRKREEIYNYLTNIDDLKMLEKEYNVDLANDKLLEFYDQFKEDQDSGVRRISNVMQQTKSSFEQVMTPVLERMRHSFIKRMIKKAVKRYKELDAMTVRISSEELIKSVIAARK